MVNQQAANYFFFNSPFSLASRSTFCWEPITEVICLFGNDWFMKTTCIYFCRRWCFCLIFTITLVDLSILAGGIRTATDQWVLKSIIVDTMFCNFGKYSFHSPQIKCIKHAVYKLPHEGRNDLTQITLGLGANLTFPPAFIYD